MDCLSLPDSGKYSCTNLWGVNCTNIIGFDFVPMWNITQRIQKYCPTDPRLFLNGNAPATPETAALTGQACKAIAGASWRYYPAADIWVRLTTWKFPLLQLVASSPRPPLGAAVEGFVILHLLGDPVGTIKDLLRVISDCQERADFWRGRLARAETGRRRLTDAQVDHAWKAFTIMELSYDEWGKGNIIRNTLNQCLDALLPTVEPATNLEAFLAQTNLTADALAADRATKFLPIIVAQGFFIGSIAVAIAKITANTSGTSFFINIEAHSIAFTAMYFWILPAVFLSSVIGVSQTQNAVPRILRRFQKDLSHEQARIKKDLSPGQTRSKESLGYEQAVDSIVSANSALDNERMRQLNGGVYSWIPDQQDRYEPRRLLQRNALPIMIVVAGTITAMLVSGYVPPEGWQPRHCAQVSILLAWLLSFSLTSLLKCNTSCPSYDIKWRFWLTFSKDVLATAATMGGIIATQLGVFNRCDSYTRWDHVGLALPGMPAVAAVLQQRINVAYPAIVFVSVGLQMFVIPVTIAIWYRHALLVFLQRDDSNAGYWRGWRWPWARAGRGRAALDPYRENHAAELGTRKDGSQVEQMELMGQRPRGGPSEVLE